MKLFRKPADYAAFGALIAETLEKAPLRILSYCLMPNHWHFVAWPERDGDLARFFQRLTRTYAWRWQRQRGCVGHGHVYQGRFKSFPVNDDEYYYQFVRYVEHNALRAGLVSRAEDWRWGSLWRREFGMVEQRALLSAWPIPIRRGWTGFVNQPQTEAELASLRRSVLRGRPFGSAEWVESTAHTLGLESTLRPRGRPRKQASSTPN